MVAVSPYGSPGEVINLAFRIKKYTAIAAFYPWCGMYINHLESPLIVPGGNPESTKAATSAMVEFFEKYRR